ncbi:hypothetical protein [Streptomyces tritici]|uniref:hypothetical protein n=1 Tax=Streptomyces tritici TaxID=2054410 RepID=UPI003AF123D7
MRLRLAATAAAGAFALLLSLPGSASAASGQFTYVYADENGDPAVGRLFDPPSGVCLTLSEVADEATTPPAHSPRNRTDAVATAFTGTDCTGDAFSMRPHTGYGSERLKLRSVFFS